MGTGLLPAVLLLTLQAAPGTASATLSALASALPDSIGEARRREPPALYTPSSIFDYLDGGAEVYLAYGLRGCLASRFEADGSGYTVDVFEMGSDADAFGVFTHDQDGEGVTLGRDALLRPGWLSFWQDRFFVSLTADAGGGAARSTLITLGRGIAALLPAGGSRPELIGRLPKEGLIPRSVRFLHDPVVLATHVARLDGNPLVLSPRCDVAVGTYQRGEGRATLVLAVYPDEAAAVAAAAVACRLLPGSCGQPAAPRPGELRLRARRAGNRLALALEATSGELAAVLVAESLGP